MIEWYVGTSGWSYEWNKGKSLEWYINETGSNTIELNMSFYRFPFPNMVQSWAEKGKSLAWVVKVHRSISHFNKLDAKAIELYARFQKLFEPLESNIHYYLLQMPPWFTDISAVEDFIAAVGTDKLAIEFRHPTLFTVTIQRWARDHDVVLVSVDAPKLPSDIQSTDILYIRIHGRSKWYDYTYASHELDEILTRIIDSQPKRVYLYFNNFAMLTNLQYFQQQLNLHVF